MAGIRPTRAVAAVTLRPWVSLPAGGVEPRCPVRAREWSLMRSEVPVATCASQGLELGALLHDHDESAAAPDKVTPEWTSSALETGTSVAAGGGPAAVISLFLTWFGVSGNENLCGAGKEDCTGFQTFTILDSCSCSRARAADPGLDRDPRPRAVLAAGRGDDDRRARRNDADPLQRDRRPGRGRTGPSSSSTIGWFIGLLGALMIIAGGAISQISRGGVPPPPARPVHVALRTCALTAENDERA